MIVPVLVVLILSACQQLQPGPAAPQAATTPTEATQPERPSRLLLIGDYFLQANLGVDAHLKAMAITASPPISLETALLASTSDQRSYTLKLTWDAGSALRWMYSFATAKSPIIELADIDGIVAGTERVGARIHRILAGRIRVNIDQRNTHTEYTGPMSPKAQPCSLRRWSTQPYTGASTARTA